MSDDWWSGTDQHGSVGLFPGKWFPLLSMKQTWVTYGGFLLLQRRMSKCPSEIRSLSIEERVDIEIVVL